MSHACERPDGYLEVAGTLPGVAVRSETGVVRSEPCFIERASRTILQHSDMEDGTKGKGNGAPVAARASKNINFLHDIRNRSVFEISSLARAAHTHSDSSTATEARAYVYLEALVV
jgi:hypothetical protein